MVVNEDIKAGIMATQKMNVLDKKLYGGNRKTTQIKLRSSQSPLQHKEHLNIAVCIRIAKPPFVFEALKKLGAYLIVLANLC